MKVSVISPESVLFEGEASSVVAPAFDGEVGILENHAPMMTLLGSETSGGTGATSPLAGTNVKPPPLDEFYCANEAELRAQDFAELGFSEERIWRR